MLERSVSRFLTHPAVDEVIVALPADLVEQPPAYLRTPRSRSHRRRRRAASGLRGGGVPGGIGPERTSSSFTTRRGRSRARDLIARTIAAAAECGRRAGRASPRATRSNRWTVRFVRATLDRADDLSRADAAGVPARRAARRARDRERRDRRGRAGRAGRPRRPHRRRRGVEHQDHDAGGSVDGRSDRAWWTADAGAPDATGRNRLRPASPRRGAAADSRRRHDSVRAGRRRPLRRRRRLPRRDRRDPRRRGRRRHRTAFSRHRSALEGRVEHRSAAAARSRSSRAQGLRGRQRRRHGHPRARRSSRRTSTRCARRWPRRSASTVDRVSIKGKTNEGVGELGRGEAIAVHADRAREVHA